MSYSGEPGGVRTEMSERPAMGGLPAPKIPRAALDGVRTRRIMAVSLDFLIVSFLSALIFMALLFLSFGMTAIFCRRSFRWWRSSIMA